MNLLFHSKTFSLQKVSNRTNIPTYIGLIKKKHNANAAYDLQDKKVMAQNVKVHNLIPNKFSFQLLGFLHAL